MDVRGSLDYSMDESDDDLGREDISFATHSGIPYTNNGYTNRYAKDR